MIPHAIPSCANCRRLQAEGGEPDLVADRVGPVHQGVEQVAPIDDLVTDERSERLLGMTQGDEPRRLVYQIEIRSTIFCVTFFRRRS